MHRRYGFTLVEMAMVLLLTGLVAGIALKLTERSGTAECYTTTKAQLNSVKDAVERFALKNDRFPMPARRDVGVESPVYGREAVIADLDKLTNADGTVAVFGALPFQALGVPVENASDCWGNKLTYVVTKDLTDSAKFLVPTTNGALDIKTDNSAALFLKGAGYAIISHGEDQLGAVKNNYSSPSALPNRKWCTSTAELRTQDCDVTNNALVDAAFNNGKDAAAAYFDDLIVYRGKPWRGGGESNLYCWGDNDAGQLGTGNNVPNPVPMPVVGNLQFKEVKMSGSAGSSRTCGLTTAGKVYCWGWTANPDGSNSNKPVDVSNGQVFTQLEVQSENACALTAAGDAWCWGLGNFGANGNSSNANQFVAAHVSGPHNFKNIHLGYRSACGIDTLGKAWCWGVGPALGNGNATGLCGGVFVTDSNSPVAVNSPLSFSAIRPDGVSITGSTTTYSCALDTSRQGYCWGVNNYGSLGFGTWHGFEGSYDCSSQPAAVLGNHEFSSIYPGIGHSCALTASGDAWCWGWNALGQLGDGTGLTYDPNRHTSTPVAVAGNLQFVELGSGIYYTFGLASDGKLYGWGSPSGGAVLGDNIPQPTQLAIGQTFVDIQVAPSVGNNGSGYVCGLKSDGGMWCGYQSGLAAVPNTGGTALVFEKFATSRGSSCAIVGTPHPINNGWSLWSACGPCGGPPGSGTQTRTCVAAGGSCTVGDPPESQSCTPPPCPPPINGVCDTTIYSCSAGTSVSPGNFCGFPGKRAYTWTCNGINGGVNTRCVEEVDDSSCP